MDSPQTDLPSLRWTLLLGALVMVVAMALRLPLLGDVPPALHPDEAANAADALELFRSPALTFAHEQGGWVEGPYVWLAAPGMQLEWGSPACRARLPALLAGLLLVPATFLLGRRLGGARVALVAAVLVACQPWAYHFSRLALRGTLVPPLLTLGLWLIGRGGKRSWGGGVLLAAAAASYTPARLVVPLVAVGFLLSLPPEERRRQRPWHLLGALLPVFLTAVLLLPWTLGPEGGQRLSAVSALDTQLGVLENAYRVTRGYLLHFSTRALFSGSSSRGFSPEGVGLLPLVMAPLLVLGLLALLRRRDRWALPLLPWLLLFPLAAAFTTDVPNPMRGVCGVSLLPLVAAYGLEVGLRLLPSSRARRTLLSLTLLLLLASTVRGAVYYYRDYPREEAAFYYAGRKELVSACAAQVERGETLLLASAEFPFLEAYLRLYGEAVPRRRTASDWILGSGRPSQRVVAGRDDRSYRVLLAGYSLVPLGELGKDH